MGTISTVITGTSAKIYPSTAATHTPCKPGIKDRVLKAPSASTTSSNNSDVESAPSSFSASPVTPATSSPDSASKRSSICETPKAAGPDLTRRFSADDLWKSYAGKNSGSWIHPLAPPRLGFESLKATKWPEDWPEYFSERSDMIRWLIENVKGLPAKSFARFICRSWLNLMFREDMTARDKDWYARHLSDTRHELGLGSGFERVVEVHELLYVRDANGAAVFKHHEAVALVQGRINVARHKRFLLWLARETCDTDTARWWERHIAKDKNPMFHFVAEPGQSLQEASRPAREHWLRYCQSVKEKGGKKARNKVVKGTVEDTFDAVVEEAANGLPMRSARATRGKKPKRFQENDELESELVGKRVRV